METREKTLEQLDAARLKVQQYEHKIQLLENRKTHLEKKADRQRTHHLCNMGGAIQSISKEADSLTRVVIGHLNKASGSQSTYRGLGSIDITAVVRSLLFIGKVKTDPTTRVIVHEKSSLAPPGQSLAFSLGDEKGFRWIGAYDISAEDLLAGGEGSKTELKQEQAVKLIEEFLSEGRKVAIAEINKEATERGISERTVRLARNSMGDKIACERQGKDWWIWFK